MNQSDKAARFAELHGKDRAPLIVTHIFGPGIHHVTATISYAGRPVTTTFVVRVLG